MHVRPYNEIAVAIPLMVNAKFSPPVLPMLFPFKNFGLYIAHMPVTSYENTMRGLKIWGLPKVTQKITIDKQDNMCTIKAFEKNKEYFKLRVPTNGKSTKFDVKNWLYSRHNNKVIRSQTCFKADFKVVKHLDLLWQKNKVPSEVYLEISRNKSAAFLQDLEIEQHPFQLRYAEHMNASFNSNDPAY